MKVRAAKDASCEVHICHVETSKAQHLVIQHRYNSKTRTQRFELFKSVDLCLVFEPSLPSNREPSRKCARMSWKCVEYTWRTECTCGGRTKCCKRGSRRRRRGGSSCSVRAPCSLERVRAIGGGLSCGCTTEGETSSCCRRGRLRIRYCGCEAKDKPASCSTPACGRPEVPEIERHRFPSPGRVTGIAIVSRDVRIITKQKK